MAEFPVMTRRAVAEARNEILNELGLGVGSCRSSSAYHDYVAMEFALFATPLAVAVIEREFKKLCRLHGWECCRVSANRENSVIVTMHESRFISTDGSRRMP